jgi:2-succinyl-6-hydroxy-2,4-cyclohexadiene-1-carboxylate synthase
MAAMAARAARPRVVLVPGFTQTARSWDAVRAALTSTGACTVRALQVPQCASFAATAAGLARAGGASTWVGYSMGGRLALRVALDHPEVVHRLVLVSASPGLADPAERAARAAADEALARDVEAMGVDAFLDRWLAQPLFAGVPPDAPGLAERRRLPAATLAHQLRVLGTGTMEPLWDRLGELAAPVLLVSGTADAKFGAVNDAMAGRIPGARHVRVDGGHALPLEAPGALAAAIRAFVDGAG